MVLSANLTLRTCSLGDRDDITGWYTKTFAETTIKGILEAKGATHYAASRGLYTNKPFSLWTTAPVVEDDEIIDADGTYYLIQIVNEVWKLNCFEGYFCGIVLSDPHADRPATYGIGATTEDPRHRCKDWFDFHDIPANISMDNGDAAAYTTFWAMPDYSLTRIFQEKAQDLGYAFGVPDSKPMFNYDHSVYGYEEAVPVEIFTINKAGITAANILWKAEQELRRIAETYFLGSVRQLATMRPNYQDLGGLRLYSSKYILNYRRSNETSTDITLSFNFGGNPYTFTFPNCTHFEFVCPPRNISIGIPSRVTGSPQGLGADSALIDITCDLDIAPLSVAGGNTNRWKRWGGSQTTEVKTDFVAGQIFMEMAQNEANGTEPYQTLSLADRSFAVCMDADSPKFRYEGDRHLVDLVFREYSTTSQTGTVVQRFNLTG